MTAAGARTQGFELETRFAGRARPVRETPVQVIASWLCCAYVLSQIYMVPVWLVGPSWSVWPSLADFVIPIMLVLLPFLKRAGVGVPPEIVTLQRLFLVLGGGLVLSYLVLTLDPFHLNSAVMFNDKGQAVGLYQLYRVCQSLIVFWIALCAPLNGSHRRRLCHMVGITFWISAALLLADYFHVLSTPMLAPHIPRDLQLAGPWAYYSRGVVGQPVGTIGFHHVYPSIQLLVLAALYLHLLSERHFWLHALVLSGLGVCGFVGGSRSGFVAICVFIAGVVVSHMRRFLAMVVTATMLIIAALQFSESVSRAFAAAVERQSTISSSYEDDGFAGRVEIWNERVVLLNDNPLLWLVGTGFGSAVQSGSNGHMLYLHITLECGLIGLAAFLAVMWRILALLWRRSDTRVVYFATIALLVSALTQETFYPVPALSQFGSLFLLCVAIAVRGTDRQRMKVTA